MYGYLTDRACRVFLEMEGEAFVLHHDHIGTEHLLIAIVGVNDDVTGPVLSRFGVTAEKLRREVRALVTPGVDFDREWTTFVIGSWTRRGGSSNSRPTRSSPTGGSRRG